VEIVRQPGFFRIGDRLIRQVFGSPEGRSRDAGVHDGEVVVDELMAFHGQIPVYDMRGDAVEIMRRATGLGGVGVLRAFRPKQEKREDERGKASDWYDHGGRVWFGRVFSSSLVQCTNSSANRRRVRCSDVVALTSGGAGDLSWNGGSRPRCRRPLRRPS